MPAPPLHIVCFRWGTRYGVEYANKLHSMIGRNLTLPHVFHCMTDNIEGLSPGIIPHLLPAGHFGGNWNKLMTFQENFLGLEGQTLVCMDVDLVIVGNIDFLADQPEEDFMIVKNWATGVRGNSSVYRLRVGSQSHVWNDFVRDSQNNIEVYHGKNKTFGDQQWMDHAIQDYRYFPGHKIVSFKRHCRAKSLEVTLPVLGKRSTGRLGSARPPHDAAIVLFHGDPLPPDVLHTHYGRWKHSPFVGKHWC